MWIFGDNILHLCQELAVVTLTETAHCTEEHESCFVHSLWVLFSGIVRIGNYLTVFFSHEGIVCFLIDRILDVLAVSSLEFKVGVRYQLGMFVVWIFCHQFVAIGGSLVIVAESRVQLIHVVICLVKMFKLWEVGHDALEGTFSQRQVLHEVFINDTRVIQSIHQFGIRCFHLFFGEWNIFQIVFWSMWIAFIFLLLFQCFLLLFCQFWFLYIGIE